MTIVGLVAAVTVLAATALVHNQRSAPSRPATRTAGA